MKNRQKLYKIACIVLLIDQILKIMVRNSINLFQEIKIIKNFFYLTHLENTGAAFSVLENSTIFLIIISVIFILFLDKYIRKEENNFNKLDVISFGLIMGGIYGNLIDRIIHRGVIDYLSFIIFKYNFPVFNFADICIVVGASLIIIDTLFIKKNNQIEKK